MIEPCNNGVKGQSPIPPDTVDTNERIIIVGAGPVGTFLALKLAQAKIPVDILERDPTLQNTPRACGYFGAPVLALKDAGVYDLVREEGFMTAGLCWRKLPVDDGKGGKRLGEMIAKQPLGDLTDSTLPFPSGLLNLRQSELNKLFLREALKTGYVKVHYSSELQEIENDGQHIIAIAKNPVTGAVKRFSGSYLVGTDGGKSKTRKLLGVPCLGHTWPERLIATDVLLQNREDLTYHTSYIMDTKNFGIMTPLTEPIFGQKSLWRCTLAIPSEDTRSDDEIIKKETLYELYDKVMAGPRPLQVDIQKQAVYKIHQRLVTTMRKGRCLLAGDAAHLNNPFGAMGLNTGLLDADALAEALVMVLKESKPDLVLDLYSDERRKVFQHFVDPTSTANLLRLHSPDAESARKDDYYFRKMQNPNAEVIAQSAEPYFKAWRTDMRYHAKFHGL